MGLVVRVAGLREKGTNVLLLGLVQCLVEWRDNLARPFHGELRWRCREAVSLLVEAPMTDTNIASSSGQSGLLELCERVNISRCNESLCKGIASHRDV